MEVFASPGSLYDFSIVVQISSLAFLLGYWFLSFFLAYILETRSEKFREMKIRRKRNVITYVLEIAASTYYAFFALTVFLLRLVTVSRVQNPLDKMDMYITSGSEGGGMSAVSIPHDTIYTEGVFVPMNVACELQVLH